MLAKTPRRKLLPVGRYAFAASRRAYRGAFGAASGEIKLLDSSRAEFLGFLRLSCLPYRMPLRVTRLFVVAGSGLLVSVGFAAHAQNHAGIRAGVNGAHGALRTPSGQLKASSEQLLGGQVGLVLNLRYGNLAFQPGLLFSRKGYAAGRSSEFFTTYSVGDTLVSRRVEITRQGDDYLRLTYLEVPLNAVYSFGKLGAQLIRGPYLGVGLSGKVHADGYAVAEHTTK